MSFSITESPSTLEPVAGLSGTAGGTRRSGVVISSFISGSRWFVPVCISRAGVWERARKETGVIEGWRKFWVELIERAYIVRCDTCVRAYYRGCACECVCVWRTEWQMVNARRRLISVDKREEISGKGYRQSEECKTGRAFKMAVVRRDCKALMMCRVVARPLQMI